MRKITLRRKIGRHLLAELNSKKVAGPYRIPPIVLKMEDILGISVFRKIFFSCATTAFFKGFELN